MTNPIRAALDKARAVYCHADGECPCATPDDCPMKVRSDVPAKIIAAFLRALPDNRSPATAMWWYSVPVEMETHHWLADAVLAAAKDQTND
ncbi:MAG: hypothetical protein ACK5QX_12240 [bacterium]|jgi:hypothetical protein